MVRTIVCRFLQAAGKADGHCLAVTDDMCPCAPAGTIKLPFRILNSNLCEQIELLDLEQVQ